MQIPRSAVVETASDIYVYVVEDDIAIRRSIETGFGGDGMVEVTSGLTDSDRVITVGQVGLKNEAKVVVINAATEVAE
jgi:membrane fusion protein (multidrug efflux system)